MKILRTITERCGLHGESIPGNVLIEIHGEDRVLIENHRGIQDFTEEAVRLFTTNGPLCIYGSSLSLCEVRENALIVHGCIRRVDLPEDGGAE